MNYIRLLPGLQAKRHVELHDVGRRNPFTLAGDSGNKTEDSLVECIYWQPASTMAAMTANDFFTIVALLIFELSLGQQ